MYVPNKDVLPLLLVYQTLLIKPKMRQKSAE